MAFTDLELKLIDKIVGGLCREMNSPEFIDELSIEYRIDRHDVVLFEKRPAYQQHDRTTEIPAAKLKYFRTQNEWRLFWMRGDLKWHAYKPFTKSRRLSDLVAVVKDDPHGCFWG